MTRFSLVDAADADLAQRAASGDNTAFAELYRRHADAAWRVAQAVTHNPDDAADAVSDAFTRVLKALPEGRLRDGDSFRAYLLTATRRAGVDQLRRRKRQQAGGDTDALGKIAPLDSRAAWTSTPTEKLMQATDSALVASAFRGLPERWRSVLWLTEVEQIPAKEAAPLLGMSPNGVAQLAVRARNGLRERFIQAHLRDGEVPPECRYTVERLGAYVAGALPPRDLAKVDQHLAGCEPCRTRHAELEDLGGRLRRVIVPLPLGLGAAAWKTWAHNAGFSVTGKIVKTASWAAKAERPLAVLSAALFAAGIAGTRLVGGDTLPTGPSTTAEVAAPPRVDFDVQSGQTGPFRIGGVAASATSGAPAEDLSRERRRNPAAGADTGTTGDLAPPAVIDDGPQLIDDGGLDPTPDPNDDGDDDGDGGGPGPTPAKPAVQANVAVSHGGTGISVSAGQGGGSCTGGTVLGQTQGCAPPPPNGDALITVSTGGSAVPVEVDEELKLP